MGQSNWLCIDQGGQSTRAAIYDQSGALVALGRAAIETNRHGSGFVEHDAAALLESVSTAIEAACREGPAAARSLRGAALATQRSTLVCAQRGAGTAITPVISWQDRRGADALAEAMGDHAARIGELTGLKLSPHYGAGKLRWCLDHLPAVQAAADRNDLVAAPLAAFVLHHLMDTQPWHVDPVNASRMLLMDLRNTAWSPELLGLFGIDPGWLPSVRPCRSGFGCVSAAGTKVPLTVCTGDQPAALFCAGAPDPGTLFINVGTGAFIQCATGEVPVRAAGLLTSIGWQDDKSSLYVLEGTVNGAASAVEDMLKELEIDRPAASDLESALEGIGSAPLYLNGVSGLGSPDWIADFPSRFVGHGAKLQRLAAVYESIVFLIMRNFDAMRDHVTAKRIIMTGGLARIDWFGQYLASLSGLRVERPDDAEATLRGLCNLVMDRYSAQRRKQPASDEASHESLPDGGSTGVTPSEKAIEEHRMTSFPPATNAMAVARYRAWTAEMDQVIRECKT